MSSLVSSDNVERSSTVSPSPVSPSQESVCPSSTVLPDLPQNVCFQISFQLSNTVWTEELFDCSSETFVALATNLTASVSGILTTVGNAKIEFLEFRPGGLSVIAVLEVTALSSNERAMKTQLATEMKIKRLWMISVDPVLYSGVVFDVVLSVQLVCSDSALNKGFNLKEELVKAISKVMSSNPTFIGASVQGIDCSQQHNITMVTARTQIGDPSASNPYKELSSLKREVDVGRVGNFSVLSEWKSYIPGEKLFHVFAVLETESSDTIQTKKELENFIANKFKDVCEFRFGNVEMPENKTAVIEIGMRNLASAVPSLTLSPLSDNLGRGRFGNVTLVRNKIRVTIDSTSLTRKIFEVEFLQYVPRCSAGDLTDPNSSHYQNLSQEIWQFIDKNIRTTRTTNQVYLKTKVINLNCRNATIVRSVSNVYMKPTAEDDIGQLIGALYKCKTEPGIYDWGVKITLKTPTVPDTRGTWSPLQGVFIHYVCPKSKPSTPPSSAPSVTMTTYTTPSSAPPVTTTTYTTPRQNMSGKFILCVVGKKKLKTGIWPPKQ